MTGGYLIRYYYRPAAACGRRRAIFWPLSDSPRRLLTHQRTQAALLCRILAAIEQRAAESCPTCGPAGLAEAGWGSKNRRRRLFEIGRANLYAILKTGLA